MTTLTVPNSTLMDLALDGLLYQCAHDDLGIYCQSVTLRDGTVKERTEWQNGWNAAGSAMLDKVIEFEAFFKTLEPTTKDALVALMLLEQEAISLHLTDDSTVKILANMNDTFYYATADNECIDPQEISTVVDLYQRYGFDGIVAWAAKKRNQKPIYENEKLNQAITFLGGLTT